MTMTMTSDHERAYNELVAHLKSYAVRETKRTGNVAYIDVVKGFLTYAIVEDLRNRFEFYDHESETFLEWPRQPGEWL